MDDSSDSIGDESQPDAASLSPKRKTLRDLPPGISLVLMDQIANLPDEPGVYLFKDSEQRVIYVGKAKRLRRRVAQYVQGKRGHSAFTSRIAYEAHEVEGIETGSEVEALLVENRLIKELQPRLNVKLKDDKEYPLIAITKDEFPRVFCTRDRTLEKTDYVGPFTSAKDLYRAYNFLMRVFRFRACDLDLREGDPGRASFRPCLNWHIKRCSAPCTLKINGDEYRADIKALRDFLAGRKRGSVITDLTARMKSAAGSLRFEDAARLRDQIRAMERLRERGSLRDYEDGAAPAVDHVAGLTSLQQVLGLANLPRVIDGFDIAHLQGTHVVASCVHFVGGVPDKDGYRRFKVQGVDGDPGNNDFAAMQEIVGRRLRRLQDEGQPLPDLLLIDGGHGQVAAALEACRIEGVVPPCLIGLAKAEETIICTDGRAIQLSKRDPGLRLLMYVRDEAHRFCRRYFHLLQRKALSQ